MTLLLFGLALVSIFYVLKALVSVEFASVVLSVISVIVSITFSEVRYLLGFDRAQGRTGALSRLRAAGRAVAPAFEYADLSFLLLATALMSVFLYNAFGRGVEDLVQKGFLTFAKDKDGIVHLKTYLAGFVLGPLQLQVLVGYGFLRGFKARRISLAKLFAAVLFGTYLTTVVLFGVRGGSPAVSNYEKLAGTHPDVLPIGVQGLPWFVALSMSLLMDAVFALVAWLAGQCGRTAASVMARLAKRQ